MIWNEYPYSNVHELNLDWLLKKMKELNISFEDLTKYVNGEVERLDDYLKIEIEKLNQYLVDNLSQTLEQLIAEGYFAIDLAYDYDDVEEALTFKLVATQIEEEDNNG